MARAPLECEVTDGVNSSDWLSGRMSIQLRPEAVSTVSVGSAPWNSTVN